MIQRVMLPPRRGALVFFSVVARSFAAPPATLRAKWTRLALPDSPSARSSHKLSSMNGKAYLFGGESTARTAIDSSIHCLSEDSSGTWRWQRLHPSSSSSSSSSSSLPPARVGHAQAVVQTDDGPRLLIFGGRAGVEMGEQELDDLWSFEPPSAESPDGVWTKLEAPAAPSARSFHAATSVGSKMFVFGGCGACGRMADLHAYDAASNSWETLPAPPAGVVGRGGATLEASAAGGGGDDEQQPSSLVLACGFAGYETNDLLRFCLGRGAWERAPSDDEIRPRSVVASFAFPRGLLLFGGEVSPSDRGHEGAGGFAGDLLAIDSGSGSGSSSSSVEGGGEGGSSWGKQLGLTVDSVEGGTEAAGEQLLVPAPRGWAAATALSESRGVLFGGLAGTDDEPERLGDTWLLDLVD